MFQELYTWARQIIVFLLVTELFAKLASEKYRKHLKLAISLCLVFLVAAPILRYITKTDFSGLLKGAIPTSELSLGDMDGNGKWEDGVLKEYENLVKRQLSEVLYGLGLTVKEVELWRKDGMVDGMTVWVLEDVKKESPQKEDPISITEIVVSLEKEEGKESTGEGAVLEFVAQMRIADFYDMDVSHINVIKEE